MRTEKPENLIEVSYHSMDKPCSAFVALARLQFRETTGGCVPLYRSDGSPVKWQAYGDFDWTHKSLNVANVIERGNPRLNPGWESRAEQWMEKFWHEFNAKDLTK